MPVRDRIDLRRRLVDVASAQSGYFTAAQARSIGYSYSAQHYHVHRGNWDQVDRGLFRLPEWPIGLYEQYVRWYLWSSGRGVISHETALSVHELGDVNPARVHLTVPPGYRRKAHGVVLHTGEFEDDDVEQRQGFEITTPVRSLADVALGDLAMDQLVSAVSDGLDRGMFTRRMLVGRADRLSPFSSLRIERAFNLIDAR